MPVECWGELEGGVIAAVKQMATTFVRDNVDADAPEATVQTYIGMILTGMSEGILQYYDDMVNNRLGNPPDGPSCRAQLNSIWQGFLNSDEGKLLTDEAATPLSNLEDDFVNLVAEKMIEAQQEMHAQQTTIDDISCFRLATDGRTTGDRYNNFNQAAIQQIGNLATFCATLDIRNQDSAQIFNNDRMAQIRRSVTAGLQGYTNSQVTQPMDPAQVQVYLCSGYGVPDNALDLGAGQVFPEHMWLEVHALNNQFPNISIDTFPNASVRIVANHEGAPSEPSRVNAPDKTIRVPITGLPEGVEWQLKNGLTVQANSIDDLYGADNTLRYQGIPMHIATNGTITFRDEAENSFNVAHNIQPPEQNNVIGP